MKSRRTAVLLVGGALALGLGACGGGGNTDETGDTGANASQEATQEQAKEAPATKDGLTAPGTKLEFGQQANLAWVPPSEFDIEKGSQGYRLGVSVDAIEKGSISDFDEVELEGDEKESIPYYVKISIEAMEEVPASVEDDADLEVKAIDDRGQEQASITFLGEFSRCNDAEMPKPMKAGESFESCMAYLMPGGGSIVEAEWDDGPATAGEVTPYFDEPVVWGP
jgi:hypothetical protein